MLRPGGRLGIADVQLGSPPDRFLNGFVHEHSRTGHQGVFLDAAFAETLRAAGLAKVTLAMRPLRWRFTDACRDGRLHAPALRRRPRHRGRDPRPPSTELLGTEPLPGGGIALRWGLLVATGRKPG